MTKQFTGNERPVLLSGGSPGVLRSLAPLRVFSRALSNADIRHLHTRPLTLLRAPGKGLAYVIVLSAYQVVTVGAAFSNGHGGLYYGDTDVQADTGGSNSPFAFGSSVFLPPSPMAANSGLAANDTVEDMPIVLKNTGADMAAGGGYGRITFWYFALSIQTASPN